MNPYGPSVIPRIGEDDYVPPTIIGDDEDSSQPPLTMKQYLLFEKGWTDVMKMAKNINMRA